MYYGLSHFFKEDHTISMSYREARLKLDRAPLVRFSRSDKYVWSEYFTRSDSRVVELLTDSNVHTMRATLFNGMRCAVERSTFMTYKGIDQQSEGACSLVGFLNLLSVNYIKIAWGTYSPAEVHYFWADIWDKMQDYSVKNGMEDIAAMLDAAVNLRLLTTPLIKALIYVPVRSVNNSENSFNPIFTQSGDVLHTIEAFIKERIDSGIPVFVNSHEHTRVCVGYQNDHFVFADSWGDEVNQEEFDPIGRLVNKIQGGYSLTPIRMIVSYVRELVYFQTPTSGPAWSRNHTTRTNRRRPDGTT